MSGRHRSHIVVGFGQIGKSIAEVLCDDERNYVKAADMGWTNAKEDEVFDVMHICFGWTPEFDFWVEEWIAKYPADLVIVHSTVPVGTCDTLHLVHSPVSGRHPNLAPGIRTFTKWFGGERAMEAAEIFSRMGCLTRCYPTARITEAMKIWATTLYGLEIMIEKEVHEWCCRNGLPFKHVYQTATKDYDEGYQKMGEPKFSRPFLDHVPGPIGGHCVIPNLEFLPDSHLAQLLKQRNEWWKDETDTTELGN